MAAGASAGTASLTVADANALLESAPTAAGGCADSDAGDCALGVFVRTIREPSEQEAGIFAVSVAGELVVPSHTFQFPLPASLREWAAASGEPVLVTTFMGQPLPAWLRYDAEKQVLMAQAAPADALPLRIRVGIGARSAVFTVALRQANGSQRGVLVERAALADSPG